MTFSHVMPLAPVLHDAHDITNAIIASLGHEDQNGMQHHFYVHVIHWDWH